MSVEDRGEMSVEDNPMLNEVEPEYHSDPSENSENSFEPEMIRVHDPPFPREHEIIQNQ